MLQLTQSYTEKAVEQLQERINSCPRHEWFVIHAVFQHKQFLRSSTAGGCGSFYAIQIVDEAFEGLNKVKQHQKVNGILAEEVARWQ